MRKRIYIFVYESLRMGGIETLLTRLASFMTKSDQQFYIALTRTELNDRLLEKRINYVSLLDSNLNLSSEIKKIILTNRYAQYIIVSLDSGSAATAAVLECFAVKNCIECCHITGVFHPRAYFMTNEVFLRKLLNWIIANTFYDEEILFMNEEALHSHKRFLLRDFTHSKIANLPLIDPDRAKVTEERQIWRLISLGRLVDFKAYNMGIPGIAHALNKKGIRFRWDIYGDGPLLSEIETKIISLEVEEFVRLKGNVAYEKLPDLFLDYDLFLGCGTSALEAAQHGLPSICAVIDSPDSTYGFIHELPIGNVGERLLNRELLLSIDKIEEFFKCSMNERRLISIKGIEYTRIFSCENFLKALYCNSNRKKNSMCIFVRYSVGLFLTVLHHRGNSSMRQLLRWWIQKYVQMVKQRFNSSVS